MILNPSFLFPEVNGNWVLKKVGDYVTCHCGVTKEDVKTKATKHIWSATDKRSGTKVEIEYVQCSNCKTIYWSCNNWIWVTWMTDKDMLRYVLSQVPIRHIYYEPGALAIHSGTLVKFGPEGMIAGVE